MKTLALPATEVRKPRESCGHICGCHPVRHAVAEAESQRPWIGVAVAHANLVAALELWLEDVPE